MNLVELLVELHINLLVPIKKAALKNSLTLSQTLCIISIPFDGISQSKLTKKLCLDLSTLTRNLDKLINNQIINKQLSQTDKRSYVITLTKKGCSIYKNIFNDINMELGNLYKDLQYEEIDTIINSLTKINWATIKINQKYSE